MDILSADLGRLLSVVGNKETSDILLKDKFADMGFEGCDFGARLFYEAFHIYNDLSDKLSPNNEIGGKLFRDLLEHTLCCHTCKSYKAGREFEKVIPYVKEMPENKYVLLATYGVFLDNMLGLEDVF